MPAVAYIYEWALENPERDGRRRREDLPPHDVLPAGLRQRAGAHGRDGPLPGRRRARGRGRDDPAPDPRRGIPRPRLLPAADGPAGRQEALDEYRRPSRSGVSSPGTSTRPGPCSTSSPCAGATSSSCGRRPSSSACRPSSPRPCAGRKVLVNVQDIHPDLAIESGILRNPAGDPLRQGAWRNGRLRSGRPDRRHQRRLRPQPPARRACRRRSWPSCRTGWTRTSSRPGPRTIPCPAGSASTGKFVVMYSGTLSISSNRALGAGPRSGRARLADDREIVFAVVGEGLKKDVPAARRRPPSAWPTPSSCPSCPTPSCRTCSRRATSCSCRSTGRSPTCRCPRSSTPPWPRAGPSSGWPRPDSEVALLLARQRLRPHRAAGRRGGRRRRPSAPWRPRRSEAPGARRERPGATPSAMSSRKDEVLRRYDGALEVHGILMVLTMNAAKKFALYGLPPLAVDGLHLPRRQQGLRLEPHLRGLRRRLPLARAGAPRPRPSALAYIVCRKTLHFVEYGLLVFLLYRAFRGGRGPLWSRAGRPPGRGRGRRLRLPRRVPAVLRAPTATAARSIGPSTRPAS
ncbi:MAG: hypothetical protein MZV64_10800 [Ignavibacteriales bacterium]|nr:hypothetical protein [Ignavibacteriales bacterium]